MPPPTRRVSASTTPPLSQRGRAVPRWLFLFTALLACSPWEARKEERALRDARVGMDRRVAELTLQSQSLARDREEEKEWEARAEIHCAPRDVQRLVSQSGAWAPSAQVSVREQDNYVVRLFVVGEGPGTSLVDGVEGLARQAPYFSLEEASARENQWTLVLRSARHCRPRGLSRLPSRPANEPPSARHPVTERIRFQTEENQRLGEALDLAMWRSSELERELGPDANLRPRLEELRAIVEAAERDNDRSEDGVRRRLPLVHALFDVPGPGPGVLRTYRRELVYEGDMPLAEEAWTARLAGAGFRVARREGNFRVLIPD